MKRVLAIAIILGLGTAYGIMTPQPAQAQSSGCMSCHEGIEQFVDGPIDVFDSYSGFIPSRAE